MSFLKSIDFDFRGLIHLDRSVYKRPLIPSVLWNVLDSLPIHRWGLFLRRYRIEFTYEYVDDPVHTLAGEYDEDKNTSVVHALASPYDTRQNFIFMVIQVIMHEYIHASQAYCNTDQFNNVESDGSFLAYISEWREIQALAHCSLLEMLDYQDRPARTVEWYSEAPAHIKKKFYKFIFRWYAKYRTSEQLIF